MKNRPGVIKCFRPFALERIKMENLNLVSLPHFVSVENLSVEEVEALINRAEYFKNGERRLI